MLLIQQPSMQWVDPVKNSAIFQGKMYFGLPRTDPKVLANRVQVYYFDTLGNPQPLPQPVNLSDSGVPTYLNNPVEIYANETCSIRVDDRNGLEKYLVDEYPLRSSEVVGVDSIKSLPSADFATGQYSVTGFYAGSTIGGGAFVWDATRDKADHNGGTVIAQDAIVAWDGTQADLATLLDWTGSGSGCYVKLFAYANVAPEEFGAIGDGIANDTDALRHTHLSEINVLAPASKTYLVNKSNYIPVFDGKVYDYGLSKIVAGADCEINDSVGIAGRYNNGLLALTSAVSITSGIVIKNLNIYSDALKVNGIYLADSRGGAYLHTEAVTVENVSFESVGEQSGFGGQLDCTAGGLFLGHGYILKVLHSSAEYCGQGVMALGSKLAYIDDFRSVYCGVSRDFTTTANGASLLLRSSEIIHVVNSYSYVTGGSAYFVSQDGNEQTKHVYVVENTLVGSGFSAISAGARTYTPVSADIESIIIKDNVVRGFCCGINADLHSGIKVSLESAFASTIKSIEVYGTVDYLAPWESFNDATGDVVGSYNIKKTKGNDVGSQFSVTVIMGEDDYCESAKINVQTLNHQRGGLAVENIENASIDCFAYNCGWSKTLDNEPFQIQQPVYVKKCAKAEVTAVIEKTCFLVDQNQDWCSPLYLSDNSEVSLDITTRNTGNQLYSIRIQNTVSGCNTTINSLDLDKFVLDAGYRYYLDLSAGAFSKSHTITSKLGVSNVSFITGSRTLPPLTEIVKSDFPPRTITLENAMLYSGSVIEFGTQYTVGSGTLSINAAAGDNIDGSASYVVPSQSKVRLYSDPFTANLWRVIN